MGRRAQPQGGQAPVVQRIRIRYAKRGPLRFTSHRDFARAFERAVRRAGVPIAYSQGFTPHPKISYASAAPTGVASEAEYLEIGLQRPVDPAWLRDALDAALSPGLDVLEAVAVRGAGGPASPAGSNAGPATSAGSNAGPASPAGSNAGLAELIDATRWRIELPGVSPVTLQAAVTAFLAAPEVRVERLTKQGKRALDARAPVVAAEVVHPSAGTGPSDSGAPSGVTAVPCAILDLVVRQVTPSVRPDDILSGLRAVADLEPPVPPRATRLVQGTLTAHGQILDPLRADRDEADRDEAVRDEAVIEEW